jgi:hypothetical protein
MIQVKTKKGYFKNKRPFIFAVPDEGGYKPIKNNLLS